MQILDAIARRLDARHEEELLAFQRQLRAELTYANVYVFARGSGAARNEARERATAATRTVTLEPSRRRHVEETVEAELALSRVPVQ